jgi:hypothetical protein
VDRDHAEREPAAPTTAELHELLRIAAAACESSHLIRAESRRIVAWCAETRLIREGAQYG